MSSFWYFKHLGTRMNFHWLCLLEVHVTFGIQTDIMQSDYYPDFRHFYIRIGKKKMKMCIMYNYSTRFGKIHR